MSYLRLALRSLSKSPGFTLVAVLTLALCIGANSAIFSVVNAVLLKPFPYPESDRLAYVNNSYPGINLAKAGVSIPDYFDRMERAPSIEDGAIFSWQNYNLSNESQPVRTLGIQTSASLFSTLRVPPALGRVFTPEETEPGAASVVVLSHELWRDWFGARETVLGETITLSGVPYEVIGVMPESFYFPQPWVKLWVPFVVHPAQRTIAERGNEYSEMIVRLKPDATVAGLSADCATIVAQNIEHYPEFRPFVESSGFTGVASSLLDETVAEVRPMLWLLQAGVIAALLIGCANVANLLLTRAVARERELAIRSALGATRGGIIRQLLTESLLLFAIGGGLGLLVALWGLSGMQALGIANLPRGHSVELNQSVFLFTLGCAGLTGVGFGLLPALQASRPQAGDAFRAAGGRTTAGRRQRVLRNTLVVTEIALSLMLVTTAVLLTRSFWHLQHQSPGFESSSVLTARLFLPEQVYPDATDRVTLSNRVLDDLRNLPGVERAGLTSTIPFGVDNSQGTYHIEGLELSEGQASPHGQMRSVSPGYFETMQIPLQQGRLFNQHDHADAENVVIIDRVLAERYWPGENPVGRRLYRGDPAPENMLTIVGVVAAVKHSGLDDPVRKETVYFPYAQRPLRGMTLTLRTSLPPESLIDDVRASVLRSDANLPIYNVRTMAGRIEESLINRRAPMLLLAMFSGMAVLLAALGIYGVLAFSVGQRTKEIGIRMALGALARNVLMLIVGQGLRLVVYGMLLGTAGYLALSHLLRHLLFEIAPTDPWAIAAAIGVLGTVALLACLLPAQRAARVSPIEALRDE